MKCLKCKNLLFKVGKTRKNEILYECIGCTQNGTQVDMQRQLQISNRIFEETRSRVKCSYCKEKFTLDKVTYTKKGYICGECKWKHLKS